MAYSKGDPVWIDCSRAEWGLVGTLPGFVGEVCGVQSLTLGRLYRVEIVGHPSGDGSPYCAFEVFMRPRRDPPKQDWEKLCDLKPVDARSPETVNV